MKVVVIGCGRVGAGLATRLALDSHQVSVVDRDPDALQRLGPTFSGTPILGHGLDHEVLVGAGVRTADALAAATGSDEINAVISRVAITHFRVPRVVARLYDPRQAELYNRLGVATISPSAWGVGRLHELLVLKDVASVLELGGGQVDLLEFVVPAAMAGHRVSDYEYPGEVRAATVSRGSRTFVADPGTVLEAGDTVTVSVAAGSADRIERLLT